MPADFIDLVLLPIYYWPLLIDWDDWSNMILEKFLFFFTVVFSMLVLKLSLRTIRLPFSST